MKIDKNTKVQSARFFETEIRQTSNGVIVELPDDILRHLKIGNKDKATVHFVVTNGIVQISGENPQAEIPLFNPEEFQSK